VHFRLKVLIQILQVNSLNTATPFLSVLNNRYHKPKRNLSPNVYYDLNWQSTQIGRWSIYSSTGSSILISVSSPSMTIPNWRKHLRLIGRATKLKHNTHSITTADPRLKKINNQFQNASRNNTAQSSLFCKFYPSPELKHTPHPQNLTNTHQNKADHYSSASDMKLTRGALRRQQRTTSLIISKHEGAADRSILSLVKPFNSVSLLPFRSHSYNNRVKN